MAKPPQRLGPEVNRILYCKNLPFAITGEELYDLFGCASPPCALARVAVLSDLRDHLHRKYGAIRQIRM